MGPPNRALEARINQVLRSGLLLLTSGLLVVGALAAGAASYQKTDGTVVDPIRYADGRPHLYGGANLEPFAELAGANLASNPPLSNRTILTDADLRFANLAGADMIFADLTGANLTGARQGGASKDPRPRAYYNISPKRTLHYLSAQ